MVKFKIEEVTDASAKYPTSVLRFLGM